ncbi:MAG: cupin domain-containing protein [Anaerolineales bacterium]|jgi:quercetin dioxygenase-like cupin family protein
MPVIIEPDVMKANQKGDGWTETTIGDSQLIKGLGMVARHWSFKPGTLTQEIRHGDHDEMLYVIAGSGIAHVSGKELNLEPETLVWLEPGDRYFIQAGAEGLEILQGYAPGS